MGVMATLSESTLSRTSELEPPYQVQLTIRLRTRRFDHNLILISGERDNCPIFATFF